MHVHLPKPLHGWRAFVGEVGIIVLGVLIALGAEQIVKGIHQRYLEQQAIDHIRSELAFDSAFAAERVAIGDCMRAGFTDVRRRLIANAANWPGLRGQPIAGAPTRASTGSLFASQPFLTSPHRLWPMSAWFAATNSGVFNQGQRRFFNYAALYAMVDWLGRLQDHEIADYSKLPPLNVPQRLDPGSRFKLIGDIDTLDADNADIEHLASVFVGAARNNGIPPDARWMRRVLGPDSRRRGNCVKQGPALDAAIEREFSADTR